MPLYIPWLTETIKKRGVRYLLHHYLGQFFEEKLTLEQLSIDIYEGKGSIKDLALDVDGLNDELEFVPFKFLDGCLIGQISVEVPWSSLATEACKVELDDAKFVCRLKTSKDTSKTHCTESTLLNRSLMTSSMQMAEEIVTTEDDEDYESPNASVFKENKRRRDCNSDPNCNRRKDAVQMFEGLEMFAQLIDSVLRRTKLTARNTLFQIQPQRDPDQYDAKDDDEVDDDSDSQPNNDYPTIRRRNHGPKQMRTKSSSSEEFSEPLARSCTDADFQDSECGGENKSKQNVSNDTVEFFIRFFRCEEILDQDNSDDMMDKTATNDNDYDEDRLKRSLKSMPEMITKLLTLEDVEMRIGGIPVSNLIGKHTITIKFNGHKSEIAIFSGSPLLAVISHEQLVTFFNVFDSASDHGMESSTAEERNQNFMSPEDYAKIENQLMESVATRQVRLNEVGEQFGGNSCSTSPYYVSSRIGVAETGSLNSRRWVGGSGSEKFTGGAASIRSTIRSDIGVDPDLDYHQASSSRKSHPSESGRIASSDDPATTSYNEPTLDNIEAFSCELKLPGIWLCIMRDGEELPPLIKPYADSVTSFQSVNTYIDKHIKVPHIRFLALKVALDITASGINIFLGDLDVSEYLHDDTQMNMMLKLLHNDMSNYPMDSPRYKISLTNSNDVRVDLLANTRLLIDPTMIDRIIYDYKLIKLIDDQHSNPSQPNLINQQASSSFLSGKRRFHRDSGDSKHSVVSSSSLHMNMQQQQRRTNLDFNLTLAGEQLMIELLCPIPDLTLEAEYKPTLLRPQSFLFEFRDLNLTWRSEVLNISADELYAYVKTQPKQADSEAVKFIESICKDNDRISLTLEPSPSNLDDTFPNEVEQVLNESSMFDSIYVGQSDNESTIPTSAFQTKRKLVKGSPQQSDFSPNIQQQSGNNCDHEKILTPGDRQHLLNYLNQTFMSTKFSLSIHLPICEVEFEDKEQLDLIYNRFGNDFVFWSPMFFDKSKRTRSAASQDIAPTTNKRKKPSKRNHQITNVHLYDPINLDEDTDDDESMDSSSDYEDYKSRNSARCKKGAAINEPIGLNCHENAATCKIVIDEIYVKFNHQGCAASQRQEISAENLLLGVVIDIDKKPMTLLSLVADNLELSSDSDIVLESNRLDEKESTFALTAEIKRPSATLKDIKLAIQLKNGQFNDFTSEIYTRFWQSINVDDEPILGYTAPRIVTELHVDLLSCCLLIVKDGARPALLAMDELYITSMVLERTSQVMIRLIADEVALYLKRTRKGLELKKNYICLIDSGLIDINMKLSQGGQLEFDVINNVISVRVCQDSLSALFKLFSVLVESCNAKAAIEVSTDKADHQETSKSPEPHPGAHIDPETHRIARDNLNGDQPQSRTNYEIRSGREREMNLLADAMNDFSTSDKNMKQSGADLTETETNSEKEFEREDKYTTALDSHYADFSRDNTEPESDAQTTTTDGDEDGGDDGDDDCDDCDNEDDNEDDSLPPQLEHQPASSACSSVCSSEPDLEEVRREQQRTCILDESNPTIADFFSAPLLPANDKVELKQKSTPPPPVQEQMSASAASTTTDSLSRAMDVSGFFVIGDDDVGAGIMDKQQHEPLVRKLIDSPIEIIENHFKMTRPRAIPEMLSASIERYVLEEMTLVVNLFGGRDFDDDDSANEDLAADGASEEAVESSDGRQQSGASGGSHRTLGLSSKSGANSSDEDEAETDLDGSLGRRQQQQQQRKRPATLDDTKPLPISGRYRAGSVAGTNYVDLRGARNNFALSSSPPQLENQRAGSSSRPKSARRRKHLSEGSGSLLNSSVRKPKPVDSSSYKGVRFGEGAVNLWESLDLMSSPDFLGARSRPSRPPLNSDLKQAGGTWRQNDVCIQLMLSKMKLLYEVSDLQSAATNAGEKSNPKQQQQTTASAPISWRFFLFIQDIEVRDKIAASDINKMLYEYCNESMPKRNTQILTVKNVATINPSDGCEECDLLVSLKPLRLNIDQDTLLFLIDFFTNFYKSLSRQRVAIGIGGTTAAAAAASRATPPTAGATTTTTNASCDEDSLPTHCHTDNVPSSVNHQPIYIKSFTFSPDVPIRLDYHAKHLDFEQGALAGMLMGLAHLDHSELVLRRVQAKHGMRGLDRVLLFALNSWLTDIKRNQLPSILSGVGPMHSVIQLFQGVRDLVWMPIDHYRKDKRLVRGLQRGASSFSSSTAMAAINLVNRFISIVQCTAQIAHDIVTPPSASSLLLNHQRFSSAQAAVGGAAGSSNQRLRTKGSGSSQSTNIIRHHRAAAASANVNGGGGGGALSLGAGSSAAAAGASLNQPRNFCEGVAVGFTIIKEGFNDTARNVSVGMQAEDMRSAVGELVRQIPSTLLNPIISATEGAQSVLVGIRNQIAPDARRDDQEKWKRRVRGK